MSQVNTLFSSRRYLFIDRSFSALIMFDMDFNTSLPFSMGSLYADNSPIFSDPHARIRSSLLIALASLGISLFNCLSLLH
jgi:hypothetical protein